MNKFDFGNVFKRINKEEKSNMPAVIETNIETKQVVEHIDRRAAPVVTEEFQNLLNSNQLLARAWDRFKKQYEQNPQKEYADTSVLETVKEARESTRHFIITRDMATSELTSLPSHPIFNNLVIPHTEEEIITEIDVIDEPRDVRKPFDNFNPHFCVYFFSDGEVLECATRTSDDAKTITEYRIQLDQLDVSEIYELSLRYSFFSWETLPVFPAIQEQFEDLKTEDMQKADIPPEEFHNWFSLVSIKDVATTLYELDEEQVSAVTLAHLEKRFHLEGLRFKKAPMAARLLCIYEHMSRETKNKQQGRTIPPLKFDL